MRILPVENGGQDQAAPIDPAIPPADAGGVAFALHRMQLVNPLETGAAPFAENVLPGGSLGPVSNILADMGVQMVSDPASVFRFDGESGYIVFSEAELSVAFLETKGSCLSFHHDASFLIGF